MKKDSMAYRLSIKRQYNKNWRYNIHYKWKKVECSLANFISKNGEEKENFGCSDCKCKSHLIYFSNKDFCIDTVKKAYENQEINFYNLEYFKSLEK